MSYDIKTNLVTMVVEGGERAAIITTPQTLRLMLNHADEFLKSIEHQHHSYNYEMLN